MKNRVIIIEDGLVYFNGDNELYKRALIRFDKNYGEIPNKLQSSFNSRIYNYDVDLIRIKYSARMIGADKLYKIILSNHSEKFIKKDILEIITELNRVLACIKQKQ